jgi:coenzyme F420-reducing hydrogenase delta subunit
MRMEYSPNVRIVKLMCTGKVDTLHLLKAIEDGADAVFVAG